MAPLLTLLSVLCCSTSCAQQLGDRSSNSPCRPENLIVDGHLVRPSVASALRPSFAWQLPAAGGVACGAQVAFQLQVVMRGAPSNGSLYDTGIVRSNISDGIRYSLEAPQLPSMRSLAVRVRVWTVQGGDFEHVSAWSAFTDFATQMSPANISIVQAVWGEEDARFVLLRGNFEWTLSSGVSDGAGLFLALTAKPSPNWKHGKHGNASKLLGAYKAHLNGVALGTGPGRTYASGIPVDTYNVTALLRPGANSLAVEAFYQPLTPRRNDTDDAGGVWAALYGGADGRLLFSTSDLSRWSVFGADAAFGVLDAPGCTKDMCAGDFAQRYFQPAENLDMSLYPSGWHRANAATATSGFTSAKQRALPFKDGLYVKAAMPLSVRQQRPLRFLNITAASSTDYSYIVDFGCNFLGGFNVTFASGIAGRAVEVRFGETLEANGSVRFEVSRIHHGKINVLNRWRETWMLRAGSQTVETHEYTVFRYAAVMHAPEPPAFERVLAWAVQYPFDGVTSEIGSVGMATCTSEREAAIDIALLRAESDPSAATGTQFSSASAPLNAVWRFARYTVLAAALDANTDSNTRQRDICNLDAFLTARYQASLAPSANVHIARLVAETLSTQQWYTNNQTEFQMAAIGAVYYHALESGDSFVASERFDELVERFSMRQRINSTTGLVHDADITLIDHPLNASIDVPDVATRDTCKGACTPASAHVATAHAQLASLAKRLGRSADAEAFSSSSASIAASIERELVLPEAACIPAAPVCLADALGSSKASLHASMFAVATGLLSQGLSAKLLPFIMGRSLRRGEGHGLECSAWAALWLERALYNVARDAPSPELSEEAASFAVRVLMSDGVNSWRGMMRDSGATMTMEGWTTGDGSITFSHPWTASPATIIPTMVMGLVPLEDAYRRVAVHPFPTVELPSSSLHFPSTRGLFAISFQASRTAWGHSIDAVELNVTIPGNTRAEVCLPTYLMDPECSLSLDGVVVVTSAIGSLQCCPSDLLGGMHHIVVICPDVVGV